MPRKSSKSDQPKVQGRPTLYREEYAEQAYKLCLLRATDEELADFFGVVPQTIENWKKEHEDFFGSITRGKMLADAEIADSLYHRGKGYSHQAVKIFMPAGASEPVYAEYTEHYPPDTAAASLWLRNRQPKKWRDKQEVELSGELGIRQITDSVLDDKIVAGLMDTGMSEEAARAYVARDRGEVKD